MPLSHADVRKIFEILNDSDHLDFLEITVGDFMLRASKTAGVLHDGETTPATKSSPALRAIRSPRPAPKKAIEEAVGEVIRPTAEKLGDDMTAVRSPMAGIFYITPSPGEPPFVEEGGQVMAGDTVCLLEIMKLFNSVKAPIGGKIHKICAAHGKPVQHDQLLMIISHGGR